MKFRKKPVIIDATQWFKHGDHPLVRVFEAPSWVGEGPPPAQMPPNCRHCNEPPSFHGSIETLESGGGLFVVCPGDWIITGVKGEHYACKPDIFAATYEKVIEEPSQSA